MVATANDTSTTKAPTYTDPHYAVATKDGWGIEMVGTDPIDGSDTDHAGTFGMPITNFTIEAEGIKKFRVRNRKGRWLGYSTAFDKTKGAGDNTFITGIEIVGKGFIFAVHIKGGGWLKPQNTSDVEGRVIGGIGTMIDAIWVEKI